MSDLNNQKADIEIHKVIGDATTTTVSFLTDKAKKAYGNDAIISFEIPLINLGKVFTWCRANKLTWCS